MTVTFPTITFPHRGVENKDAFVLAQEAGQDALSGSMTTSLELFVTEATALELNVTQKEASAVAAANSSIGASNYVGDWVSQGYTQGQSVSYTNGATYVCKLTHLTGFVPTNTTYWQPTGYASIIHNSAPKATPVDADEFGFLDSASSWIMKKMTWGNIKTALESLFAPLASPTFTGTVVLPSTTSIGTITNTELSYLDGVTSAIQTQVNSKSPLDSPTFTGTPTLPTGTIAVTQTAGDNSTKVATTAFTKTKSESVAIGFGQTWQDVTASRAVNTTYTNSTGKPIVVNFVNTYGINVSNFAIATVSGVSFKLSAGGANNTGQPIGNFIVPSGATYSVAGTKSEWHELR